MTQSAGMGWDPNQLLREQVLILSTQGGLRADNGKPVVLVPGELGNQVGDGVGVSDRHHQMHGLTGGAPPMQSLAQPVPGTQIKQRGGRQRDRDIQPREIEPGHVGGGRHGCGEAESGVEHPTELVGTHTDELKVVPPTQPHGHAPQQR